MSRRTVTVQLFVERPALAIVPFLAVALASIATLLIPPISGSPRDVFLAAASAVVTSVLAVSVPFLSRTHWVVGLPPLLFFLVVALLRHATGGDASGLTALILLPIMWIVLYGTRIQLMLSAAATGLMFAVPLILIGAPEYGTAGWPVGIVWILFIVLVCPMLQRSVEQLRRSELSHRSLAGELGSVLRAATEHSIIATDMAGSITLFSQGAERMLGHPAREMVGSATWEALHDERELSARAAEYGHAPGLATLTWGASVDVPASTVWTYRHKDGTTLLARLTVTPLLSEGNVQVGWIGIARDITAQELAQRELATAEKRWRTLLDSLPDLGVLVVGPDLRFRIAVGAGLERQGLADIGGKSLYEVSNERNVAILEPLYLAALAGRAGTTELQSTVRGALSELVVVPLPANDGEPEALILARDITDSRRREAELRTARDRFARLFSETPHGTLLLDTNGAVSQVNLALSAMLRTPVENLVGRHIDSPPLSDLIAGPAVSDLLDGRLSRLSAERTLRYAGDEVLYVSVTFVTLRGDGGEVESLLATVVDVSERRKHERQLARLADTDPLTGLANRRKFDSELMVHLERCRRHGSTGALLLLDLDNFKQINDTLGHGVGDQLIVSVAIALRNRVGPSDIVARLGGDEFAVLLPGADREAAETVAQDILQLARDSVSLLDGPRPRIVTVSVGAVLIQDADISAGELLSTADMTMYDAKEAGRDQYVLHDTANYLMPRTRARISWTNRIVRALEEDSFIIQTQPIVELSSGRMTAAEILIRMKAEDGTLIMPGRFLSTAEQTGLITDIDSFMLTRATEILRRAQQLDPDFSIAVNLSGRSIGNPRITALMNELISGQLMNGHGLILEITETAAISNMASARSFAEAVGALGCRFALDDFGAGYGSFYYLKHLLFDFVKIDGEFVAESVGRATDRLIISSIVDIAKGLGKQTIAEYVADEQILDVVGQLGVDYVQGFHIGRPENLEDLYVRLASAPAVVEPR